MPTYGQKGGEGPNTGKKGVTYIATAPDGTVKTKRLFNNIPLDAAGKPLEKCVAAMMAERGQKGWWLWFIAPSEDQLPHWCPPGACKNFVEARIKTAADKVSRPKEEHTVMTESQMKFHLLITDLNVRPGHRRRNDEKSR